MLTPPSESSVAAAEIAELPAPEGLGILALYVVLWTGLWITSFYIIRYIQPLWLNRLPRSLKAHEDDENWCARNVLGSLHATFIASISIPVFFAFAGSDDDVKFAASPHLDTCRLDSVQKYAMPWNDAGQWIAFAGMAFTTFLIADMFISYMYGLATLECRRGVDHLVHHAAFIAVGLTMRANCMMPYNASILLSMEISTPFLNYCTLMLNRGRDFAWSTLFAGSMFSFFFVAIRIGLNTYGVMFLWINSDIALPPWAPEFEFWFVWLAIFTGVVIQYLWLMVVLRKFKEHWTPRDDYWKAPANGEPGEEESPEDAEDDSDPARSSKSPPSKRPEKTPSCFGGACSVS
jgi:hypothetical protein